MPEWWTYSPEDFLMFSPRVYWRLFALHNGAFWPLPLAMQGLGIAVAALALRPRGARAALAIAGVLWAFVGWAFLWSRYGPVNWVAYYIAPLFALEAALLVRAAASGAAHRGRPWARTVSGGVLIVVALAYPLLSLMAGRPLADAEVFGMAPDPTAIGTLGLLLMTRAGAVAWPIPVLWCLFSAATLLTLGTGEGFVPLAAGLLAPAAAWIWRRPVTA